MENRFEWRNFDFYLSEKMLIYRDGIIGVRFGGLNYNFKQMWFIAECI